MRPLNKLIIAISFLSANFAYQYMQASPDWSVAVDHAYQQGVGMLFIIWYPALQALYKSHNEMKSKL